VSACVRPSVRSTHPLTHAIETRHDALKAVLLTLRDHRARRVGRGVIVVNAL
jgi:hypothetical protein